MAWSSDGDTSGRLAPGESRFSLPFRVLGSALARVFGNFTYSILANIFALILSIPLLLVIAGIALAAHSYVLIPFGAVVLLGVLPNPTVCGLQFAASELSRGEMVAYSDLWTGVRDYWRSALLMLLVSLIIAALIVVNLVFYAGEIGAGHSPLHAVAAPATALWAVALILWIAMHLYLFPLLFVQDDRRLRTTYRNAFVIVISRPFFTVFILAVWLAVLIFSSFTGLSTVIGLFLAAAIQHNATARLLPAFSAAGSTGRRETYSGRQ